MENTNQEKRFYVVRIRSGAEYKFLKLFEKFMNKEKLRHYFGKIYIHWSPVKETNSRGKVRTKVANLWPDYVIIEMNLSSKIIKLLKSNQYVVEILSGSPGAGPIPLSNCEVKKLTASIKPSLSF